MSVSLGKVVLFANTDWYLYNFRRSLALALQQRGYDVLLLSPFGPYGEKLRRLGLRWEPVRMERRSLNPFREALLLWRLFRIFRRERPLVVHSFTIKCAVYGSIAARLAGIPARINAIAGLGYVFTSKDRMARALRPVVRTLLKHAFGGTGAVLILQNPDDFSIFQRSGLVSASQVRLIRGSGVNCSLFSTRALTTEGGSLGKPPRVLLAARLLWDKGIAEFVAAARTLHAGARTITFLLAGEPDKGNPAAVLDSIVRGWVEEGVLEWLGHVDDMPTLLNTVDIVVLPSYREGLPKGLIEAAACGLPLVATDVPGCREVIMHEVDGLLVPVRDAPALALAIARLLDDRILATRLGTAARTKALCEFDEQIVIERTVAVYEELLADPTKAPALRHT